MPDLVKKPTLLDILGLVKGAAGPAEVNGQIAQEWNVSMAEGMKSRWAKLAAILGTLAALIAIVTGLIELRRQFVPYDPVSYKTVVDLKVESLVLTGKAIGPPGPYADEIESLRLKLRKLIEYEAGKGEPNVMTINQWKTLHSREGGLIGGSMSYWEEKNAEFSKLFLEEVKKNVGDAFDVLIKPENEKARF